MFCCQQLKGSIMRGLKTPQSGSLTDILKDAAAFALSGMALVTVSACTCGASAMLAPCALRDALL